MRSRGAKRWGIHRFTGGFAALTVLASSAGNWPMWRGPAMTGVTADKGFPEKWSKTENVRWRVDLPGPGNSTPVVWGDRVFVSQAVLEQDRRLVLCFDRATGKQLWQSGVTYSEPEPTQENNPYCSGSPATDGEQVYVCFGSAGVYAYDFTGREVWHRDLGKLENMFGNAVSPILHGDLCILNYGPGANARLIALNKASGKTVWEIEPPKPDPNEFPARGPGGPGGRGGRGGFGPGAVLAPQLMSQGDRDGDQALTKPEFSALADAWFDRLDPDKAGKLSQEQFSERLNLVLPAPQGSGPPGGDPPGGQGPGGGRGFGPGRFVGPGLFSAADTDENGSLTRTELKSTFEKWSSEWDSNRGGSLNEEELRAGLEAALPRPGFGGRGGPGPGGRGGRGPGGDPAMGASWSTPIALNTGNHEEVIVCTAGRLTAYDPADGRQLWMSKGLGASIYTSPVWGEGVIFAATSGPGGGPAIAVKPGGNGEVTESHRAWRLEQLKSTIGSGVVHDRHIFLIGQDGVALCLDLQTGNTIWEERLKGTGARGSSWSSMLLADGKIYVPNQSGEVFLVRASPQFEVLVINSVEEPTNASLAASNGELFMRTDKGLWCFSNTSTK